MRNGSENQQPLYNGHILTQQQTEQWNRVDTKKYPAVWQQNLTEKTIIQHNFDPKHSKNSTNEKPPKTFSKNDKPSGSCHVAIDVTIIINDVVNAADNIFWGIWNFVKRNKTQHMMLLIMQN